MTVHQEDRRSALAKIVSAGIAFLTAGLATIVSLASAPRRTATTRRWRRVASMPELSPAGPTTVVLTERHADGWYQTNTQTVMFVDLEGTGVRALSATCQHLGCRVHWDDTKMQFLCPCHGGVYDRDGRVLAGPPPRPLERLNVRVNPETSDVEVEL